MKKIVVIVSDNNPNYKFYIPIIEWVWNKLGWEMALFVSDDCNGYTTNLSTTQIHIAPKVAIVKPVLNVATVRLFVSNVLPKDALIQINDTDIIPLKEWNPDPTKKTIYGWELTGKSFIPMHYTTMLGSDWYDLMGCTGNMHEDMEREMKLNGRAYSEDWETYWNTDWDILTSKVMPKIGEFTFVNRGMVHLAKDSTAAGRVDRYDYNKTLNQPNLIDIHCYNGGVTRPENVDVIKDLLIKYHGECPEWFDSYVKEFHDKFCI
jgi:hypothetical protein